MQSIKVSPSGSVYIGVFFGGIYKSINKGQTWFPLTDDNDSLFFKEIPYLKLHYWNPDSVIFFLAVSDSQNGSGKVYELYFTYDAGNNWIKIPIFLLPGDVIEGPVGLGIIDTFLFIGFDNKVLKFNISRWTFDALNSIPSTLFPIKDLNDFFIPGTGRGLVISTQQGVHVSTDAGNTWTQFPIGDTVLNDTEVKKTFILPPSASVPAVCFATGRGVFYLDPVSGQWKKSTNSPYGVEGFWYVDTAKVYAYNWNEIYVSSNYGVEFTDTLKLPTSIFPLIYELSSIRDSLLVATSAGVFYTTDNGLSFNLRNRGIREVMLTSVDINPSISSELIIYSAGSGVMKSNDYGNSFVYKNKKLAPLITKASYHPGQGDVLYALSYFGGIYKSIDGGENWNILNSTDTIPITEFFIHPIFPKWIYLGTKDGLVVSKDSGNTWLKVIDGVSTVTGIDVSKENPERIIICTYLNGLFISNDTGLNFTNFSNPPEIDGLIKVKISPVHDSVIYVLKNSDKIFLTEDFGQSWKPVFSNPSYIFTNMDVFENNPEIVYVSLFNYPGILQSLDRGRTFFNFGKGLKDLSFYPLSFNIKLDSKTNIHRAYCATVNGLFEIKDSVFVLNGNVTPPVFTPDGDGVDDSCIFYFNAEDSSNIGILYAYIYDSLGNIVNKFKTLKAKELTLQTSIIYYGYNDTGIQILPGTYTIEAFSYDGLLNYDTFRTTFKIDYVPLQTSNIISLANTYQQKFALTNDGKIYVFYVSWRNFPEVYYSISEDGGITWSYPVNISNSRRRKSILPCVDVNIKGEIGVIFLEENILGVLRPAFVLIDSSGVVEKISFTGNKNCGEVFLISDLQGNFHVVWSEEVSTSNYDIYYRRWDTQSNAFDPVIRLTTSSVPSMNPFLVTDEFGNLYLYYSEGIKGSEEIHRMKGNISGTWDLASDSTLFDGSSPQVVIDNINNVHLFRLYNGRIYYTQFIPDSGWSSDVIVDQGTGNIKDFSVSYDSLDNIYVVWAESTTAYSIKARLKEHTEGWQDIREIVPYNARSPSLSRPHSGKILYLKTDSIPYKVSFADFESILDTFPPLIITYFEKDTVMIGDSAILYIETNELLSDNPTVTVFKNNFHDTLFVIKDSLNPLLYYSSFSTKGFPSGEVYFKVYAKDVSGNENYSQDTLYTERKGELLPEDLVIIWPNPARNTDKVHIEFSTNVNVKVKIKIYSLTGRLVKTYEKNAIGGETRNEFLWKIDKSVSSGIYMVVLEAEDPDTKEIKRVIKKVGIVK